MHESSSKSNKGSAVRNPAQYSSGSMELNNQNETRSSSRIATAVGTGVGTPVIPSASSSRKPSAGRGGHSQ